MLFLKNIQVKKNPFLGMGVFAACGFYIYHVIRYISYVNDDAFISLRYSRFISLGRGPYFNIGEHVEGYSNFLLMLFMVPFTLIGGDFYSIWFAKAIGILSGFLCLFFSFLTARLISEENGLISSESNHVGLLAALTLAICPSFAVNATSGLETLLFSSLLIAGIFLALKGWKENKWLGSGILFSLSILTRPEAIFIFGMFWASCFVVRWVQKGIRSSRFLWIDISIVVITFFLHHIFRFIVYDGEFFPNTYYAKIGGFPRWDAWTYLDYGILQNYLGVFGISVGIIGLFFSLDFIVGLFNSHFNYYLVWIIFVIYCGY